jgi:hypothetical protein
LERQEALQTLEKEIMALLGKRGKVKRQGSSKMIKTLLHDPESQEMPENLEEGYRADDAGPRIFVPLAVVFVTAYCSVSPLRVRNQALSWRRWAPMAMNSSLMTWRVKLEEFYVAL